MNNDILVEIFRRYRLRNKRFKRKSQRRKNLSIRTGHYKEHLYVNDYHQQKPYSSISGQPFVDVKIDQLGNRLTPPDPFVMAYESGLNLVGIGVALNVYSNLILNTSNWDYFTPMLYFDQYTYEDYSASQSETFDILASYIPLVVEELEESSQSLGTQGMNMWTTLVIEQLTAVSQLQVNAINIFNKVHESKEFTFIECVGNDPTYGNIQLNNASYKKGNNNFSDTTEYFGVNQNLFYEPRYHEFIKPYATRWDYTVTDEYLFGYYGITSRNTVTDSITFSYTDANSQMIKSTDIAFTYNICVDRTYTNLILTYTDVNNVSCKYVFIGNEKIEMFFRATSYFIIQPMVTGFLFNVYRYNDDTSIDVYDITMWPSPINATNQEPFINQIISKYSYGDFLSSGLSSLLVELSVDQGYTGKYSLYQEDTL